MFTVLSCVYTLVPFDFYISCTPPNGQITESEHTMLDDWMLKAGKDMIFAADECRILASLHDDLLVIFSIPTACFGKRPNGQTLGYVMSGQCFQHGEFQGAEILII